MLANVQDFSNCNILVETLRKWEIRIKTLYDSHDSKVRNDVVEPVMQYTLIERFMINKIDISKSV